MMRSICLQALPFIQQMRSFSYKPMGVSSSVQKKIDGWEIKDPTLRSVVLKTLRTTNRSKPLFSLLLHQSSVSEFIYRQFKSFFDLNIPLSISEITYEQAKLSSNQFSMQILAETKSASKADRFCPALIAAWGQFFKYYPKTVIVKNVHFSKDSFSCFLKELKQKKIESLWFMNIEVKDTLKITWIKKLAENIPRSLQELSLTHISLTDEEALELVNNIRPSCPLLDSLSLHNNCLKKPDTVNLLLHHLKLHKKSKVSYLDVSSNQLTTINQINNPACVDINFNSNTKE